MAEVRTADLYEIPHPQLDALARDMRDTAYDTEEVRPEQVTAIFEAGLDFEEFAPSLVRWIKRLDQEEKLERAAMESHLAEVERHREKIRRMDSTRRDLKTRLRSYLESIGGRWKDNDFTCYLQRTSKVVVVGFCEHHPDAHFEQTDCENFEPSGQHVPDQYLKLSLRSGAKSQIKKELADFGGLPYARIDTSKAVVIR